MDSSEQATSIQYNVIKNLFESIEKITKSFGTNKIGHITEVELEIAKKLRVHIVL